MLKVITPPTALPITLAEAKAHAIVDFCDDDAVLDGFIRGADSHLSGTTGILGYPLMETAYQHSQAEFGRIMCLPFKAVVASVTYYDENNTINTLTGWEYSEDDTGFIRFTDSFVFPEVYDRLDAVQINFTAGYAASTDVPYGIKVAIYQLIAHWYENRAAVNVMDRGTARTVPLGFNALIAPWRKVGV